MSDIVVASPRRRAELPALFKTLLAAAVLAAMSLSASVLPQSLVTFPKAAVLPVAPWIGDWLTWLARSASVGPLGVSDVTRAIAAASEVPIRLLLVILSNGWSTGYGDQVRTVVPPLSWLAVVGVATLYALMTGGRRLAALTGLGLIYIVIFGMWADAMMTVASVALSAIVAVALGVAIGAWASAHARATRAIEVAMNVMQTVPVFAYLVPTLLFLGYGPSAALVATVIYALPPMVHATILGLRSVPSEMIELGTMTGVSPRQMFWKIRVPAAMPLLSIGLNQAVMACLNMVTIAAMIGSGGLGFVVLTALRRLDIGEALQSGMAIVVLAVILDGFGQAASGRLAAGRRFATTALPYGKLALAWLLIATAAAFAIASLQTWPAQATISTAPFWNALVSWINIHCFDALDAIRSFTLIYLMLPTKAFLLQLPWLSVVMARNLVLAGCDIPADAAAIPAEAVVERFAAEIVGANRPFAVRTKDGKILGLLDVAATLRVLAGLNA